MAAGVLRPSACQPEAGVLDPQSVSLGLDVCSGQAQYLVFRPRCLVVLEHQHLLELEKKKETRDQCSSANSGSPGASGSRRPWSTLCSRAWCFADLGVPSALLSLRKMCRVSAVPRALRSCSSQSGFLCILVGNGHTAGDVRGSMFLRRVSG